MRKARYFAIDIEPRMIQRVQRKIAAEGVGTMGACVASAHELPFPQDVFDLATMIAVIGEIPEPGQALASCRRVPKPGGTLAISELFLDPDYTRASKLVELVESAGFQFRRKSGSFFVYALQFENLATSW